MVLRIRELRLIARFVRTITGHMSILTTILSKVIIPSPILLCLRNLGFLRLSSLFMVDFFSALSIVFVVVYFYPWFFFLAFLDTRSC